MNEVDRRRNRRRLGIAGTVAGLGAASVGAAVGARRVAVGRVRFRPDLYAGEPLGQLRGRPLTVVADDGLPLHVEIDGSDDARLTIVFCHGYCLNQDAWHFQRQALRRELELESGGGVARAARSVTGTATGRLSGRRRAAKESTAFRMVFWDQRSHGRSGRSDPTQATVDQTGSDLYAVLRATVRPDDKVVLVGHSMGGMSIMALATQRPEVFASQVAGVGLINTSCGELSELTLGLPMVVAKVVRPLTPGLVRGLGRRPEIVDRTRNLGADLAFMVTRRVAFADKMVSPTVVDFLEQMIRSTPISVIAEFYPALMAHDKIDALEVIRDIPALVMVAGEDRLTPAEHGRAIAHSLPEAEFIEIDQAGHILPFEYPNDVTEAVRRLVARSRPQSRERSA